MNGGSLKRSENRWVKVFATKRFIKIKNGFMTDTSKKSWARSKLQKFIVSRKIAGVTRIQFRAGWKSMGSICGHWRKPNKTDMPYQFRLVLKRHEWNKAIEKHVRVPLELSLEGTIFRATRITYRLLRLRLRRLKALRRPSIEPWSGKAKHLFRRLDKRDSTSRLQKPATSSAGRLPLLHAQPNILQVQREVQKIASQITWPDNSLGAILCPW